MKAVPLFLLFLSSVFGQITLNPTPSRVIGQDSLTISSFNPNLVEGREVFAPQGVAIDMTVSPPALYVADTGNNRVLGFRNASSFANGSRADIVIGQPDFATTISAGPGRTSISTGLAAPTGMVVDGAGNLYVADSANNRVLRFPQPFGQSGAPVPDLVLGQSGFTTNGANQGGISASTLALTASVSGSTAALQAYLTFDAGGNLWVADVGNNRVLRYNVKALGSQPSPGPAADIVLGQSDFVTNTYAPLGDPLTSLSALAAPTGLAFDNAGHLFVSESVSSRRSRILVWNPQFSIGQFAARIIGVEMTPQPTYSALQLGFAAGALFSLGDRIGVADTQANRLLIYPPSTQWTSNTLNQTAQQVIGQPDFNSGGFNQGQPSASAGTLAQPVAAAYSGNELFVADSLNHRMVVIPQNGSRFGPATRVLGQDALNLNGANLLEGREFDFVTSGSIDAGVAIDLNSTPSHLYVADTYNNRILGYKDLRNLHPGAKADLVIGQPDFQHNQVNYPSNRPTSPNQSGLFRPTGLLVDTNGDLYVADTGNGRVLRFPAPFSNYTPGAPENANLVLGQPNFFITITDPTDRTMAAPYGLSKTLFPGILVSDVVHSRVLFFAGASATLTNGQPAARVFGQPDFNSAGSGGGMNQMNAPHHISSDSDDRLYVADTGNHRVLIFDHAPSAEPNPQAVVALTNSLMSPFGLYVNAVNGAIWVADAGANTAVRFPAFNQLPIMNGAPNLTLPNEVSPRALAEDPWENLFIADAANRVITHYPGLSALNAASYLSSNVLAPGMIGALYSTGGQFGSGSQSSTALPLPTTLNGVQVLFNGTPVPLFYAGNSQINFQVPNGAPQSGTADLQVLEAATGRLLGDSTVLMNQAVPGLFAQAGNGKGAAVAANSDGTLNMQTNPAVAGTIVTIYGTGEGYVPGAPPDGQAATGALPSPQPPTVFINPLTVAPSDVTYAGIAPGQVGVWQINFRIPKEIITLPNQPTWVIVVQNNFRSGAPVDDRGIEIYVKQPN